MSPVKPKNSSIEKDDEEAVKADVRRKAPWSGSDSWEWSSKLCVLLYTAVNMQIRG